MFVVLRNGAKKPCENWLPILFIFFDFASVYFVLGFLFIMISTNSMYVKCLTHIIVLQVFNDHGANNSVVQNSAIDKIISPRIHLITYIGGLFVWTPQNTLVMNSLKYINEVCWEFGGYITKISSVFSDTNISVYFVTITQNK